MIDFFSCEPISKNLNEALVPLTIRCYILPLRDRTDEIRNKTLLIQVNLCHFLT